MGLERKILIQRFWLLVGNGRIVLWFRGNMKTTIRTSVYWSSFLKRILPGSLLSYVWQAGEMDKWQATTSGR
eukprot:scaffold388741_cov13-Prasinocladus_malaysianus.AAC.1